MRRRGDGAPQPTGEALWRDLHRPVRALIYLLIALVLIVIYQDARDLVAKVFGVLLLFVFAAIIAMLLNPLVDLLQRIGPLRGRRWQAVLTLNLLLAIVLGLTLAALIPSIVAQGTALGQQAPHLLTRVQGWLNGIEQNLNQHGIPVHLAVPSDLSAIAGPALGSVFQIVSGTISTIVNLILIGVIAIYLQIQGRELIATLRQIFPHQADVFDFALIAAGSTLAGYVRGQVIFAAAMSVYTGVALSIIGVHFALVIAVVTFFLELVPLAGAPVAIGLAVALAALQPPLVLLLTSIATLGGHLVGAYTLGLRVMSRATRVHPLVALGALLLGAELGGILGALFAVPLVGILNVYLGALYRVRRGDGSIVVPETAMHHESTLDQLPRLGEEISRPARS